jgi:hypothetical protein
MGIVCLDFIIFALLVFFPIVQENKEIVFTGLGVMLGWGGAVVMFNWGSSKSSADKTDTINDALKPPELK